MRQLDAKNTVIPLMRGANLARMVVMNLHAIDIGGSLCSYTESFAATDGRRRLTSK
jgi:hypothetical protein